ncbi:MAG: hypothetical protein Q8N14_00380, partial [Candidatus Omnitrophota bacterium]|nr:hypothetical protein [Candidatus Omnitrophota bacterium]
MKTVVGSFEDEVIKTQNLLDSLESDITSRTKDYLVSESQRSRIYAAEQEPLMKSLSIAERGLTGATGKLERTQQDILTELGLIEKEKTAPLELLEREVTIRSKIKELTDKNMPNVVKSEFNEEGDLTIVTQDEDGFHTQTMKGIGKKAEQYTSFRDVTDDSGNVTIMGIKKDGTVDKLGTFKGAGKTSTATVEKPLAPTEFNIKSGLVGFTQTQVNDIFKSTNPPKWFMDQAQKEYQMSFAGDKMSKLWKEYTDAMKKKAEGAASGGGSDWDNL